VSRAEFLAESRDVGSLPPPGPPEVAIAGRSNVGKSTLLNRLAGRRSLARTSKTPGRTRGIIFFDLTFVERGGVVDRGGAGGRGGVGQMRLADLPGYGYAEVSRGERRSWQTLIEGYAKARPTLALFLILIDARRGIEDEERQLYEWLGTIGVPAQIAFTKVDKLSAAERGKLRAETRAAFKTAAGARRAAPLYCSGQTGEGVGELWGAIRAALAPFAAPEVAAEGGPE